MLARQFKSGRLVDYEVQFNPLLIRATQKDNPQKSWQLTLNKQDYLQKLPTLKKTTSFEILEKTIAEMFEGKVCSTFVEDTGLDYLRVVCDSDLIRNIFGEIKLDLKSSDLLRDASPRAGITAPRSITPHDRRSLTLDRNRYSQSYQPSNRHSLALERETLPRDFSSSVGGGLDQNWNTSSLPRSSIPSSDTTSFPLNSSNVGQNWDTTPTGGSGYLDQGISTQPIITPTDRTSLDKEWSRDTTSRGFDSDRVSLDDHLGKREVEDIANPREEEIWEIRSQMRQLENENEDLRRMLLDMRKHGEEFESKYLPQTTTVVTKTTSYPKLTIFFFLFFGVIAAAYLVSKLI